MKKLVINKPLRVASIFFKGKQQPLRNRIVWMAGNFLVVAKDENDTAPTWYNVDRVDRLEGVEQTPEPSRTRLEQRISIF